MAAVTLFFLLAFAVTWAIWLLPDVLPQGRSGLFALGGPAFLLGVFGPGLVAVVLTARAEGRSGVARLLGRIGRWQVDGRLYLFALVYMAATKLTAAAIVPEQDTKIIGLVLKQGRACVLLVNKWDLRSGEAGARDRYTQELKRRLPFVPWAPVHFGSAMKPDSVAQLFPLLDRVAASFMGRIPTGKLNKFLQELLVIHPLPVRKGKPGKATLSAYITQVSTRPPAFALFVGHPENVTANYLKLLENRLRESFEFPGVPFRILVRKK